ncbi:MAG TPA: hypothetical protein VNL98_08625 [Gemmatimonadales bacterium]|nr:hypothetical protein [Gemmatimonadales bacterium]
MKNRLIEVVLPLATLYRPSPRPYPARPAGPEYPGHFEVRRVSRNGGIRWASHRVPVSHSILVSILASNRSTTGCGMSTTYHCRLGRFNERLGRIIDDRGRAFRHTPRV